MNACFIYLHERSKINICAEFRVVSIWPFAAFAPVNVEIVAVKYSIPSISLSDWVTTLTVSVCVRAPAAHVNAELVT